MITFITDNQPGEPDILAPLRHEALLIADLSGNVIDWVPPPRGGWTHELLVQAAERYAPRTRNGANAFLGGSWVGGTEV